MNWKLGRVAIAVLILCLVLGCDDPDSDDFRVLELRPDGITFEIDQMISTEDDSNCGGFQSGGFNLYYQRSHQVLRSQDIDITRMDYEPTDCGPFTFYIEEYVNYDFCYKSAFSNNIALTLPRSVETGVLPVAVAVNVRDNSFYVVNRGSRNSDQPCHQQGLRGQGWQQHRRNNRWYHF